MTFCKTLCFSTRQCPRIKNEMSPYLSFQRYLRCTDSGLPETSTSEVRAGCKKPVPTKLCLRDREAGGGIGGGPKRPSLARGKRLLECPLQPDTPPELSRQLNRKFSETWLFGDGWRLPRDFRHVSTLSEATCVKRGSCPCDTLCNVSLIPDEWTSL